MQSTSKLVETTAVNVDRVVNGHIVEHGGTANLLEQRLAMGAIQITQKR